MQTTADRKAKKSEPSNFPALELETRPRVSTEQAAFYQLLRPQTLRMQHMNGSYDPRLAPIKVGNRILWSTAGLRAILLGVA